MQAINACKQLMQAPQLMQAVDGSFTRDQLHAAANFSTRRSTWRLPRAGFTGAVRQVVKAAAGRKETFAAERILRTTRRLRKVHGQQKAAAKAVDAPHTHAAGTWERMDASVGREAKTRQMQ